MNPKAITTIAILILSGVVLAILVWPKVAGIQDLKSELQDSRADAAIAEQKFERTKKAIKQFDNLSKYEVDLVESVLPAEPDLPNLFVLLQHLVASSGLIGEDIKIAEGDGGLDINITVLGSYESFLSFLEAAENSLRIFDVLSITFSSASDAGGDLSRIVFGIKMKTYIAD